MGNNKKYYSITSAHADIGAFNGYIYFIVNNKILSVEVCTPNFNDYNEFRLINLRVSGREYEPEENSTTPIPYIISDLVIDKEELEYLLKWFTTDWGDKEIDMDNLPKDSPFNYLDPYDNLLVSVNYDTGYRHLINEPNSYQIELDSFDNNKSEWLTTAELEDVKLYEPKGMYKLLAHISDGIYINFYN